MGTQNPHQTPVIHPMGTQTPPPHTQQPLPGSKKTPMHTQTPSGHPEPSRAPPTETLRGDTAPSAPPYPPFSPPAPTWEPDDEAVVQQLCGVGVPDAPQGHNAGGGQLGAPGEAP